MIEQQDDRMFESLAKSTVKCKCGHSVIISKQNKALCRHCGNWVFKDKETEFKYRLFEKMHKKFD